jgi:hypothetical protein
MGDRLRVVDEAHCHLLLPAQRLTQERVLDAVLNALSRPPRTP